MVSLLHGCSFNEPRTISDLYKWLSLAENGLVKTNEVNDVKMTVKYIPSIIQAYQEVSKNTTHADFDSLISFYDKQLCFVLNFESRIEGKDIKYRGISGEQDYNERINDLSFNIGELITLKTQGTDYNPTLFHFERSFGSSKSNNVVIVFAERELFKSKGEKLDFVFVDEIFKTGINHFVFNRSSIESVPTENIRVEL